MTLCYLKKHAKFLCDGRKKEDFCDILHRKNFKNIYNVVEIVDISNFFD